MWAGCNVYPHFLGEEMGWGVVREMLSDLPKVIPLIDETGIPIPWNSGFIPLLSMPVFICPPHETVTLV